jgi:hypothetical protein
VEHIRQPTRSNQTRSTEVSETSGQDIRINYGQHWLEPVASDEPEIN